MNKIKKLMQEYCSDRSETDIFAIYSNFYSTFVDIATFIRVWDKLAIEFNYSAPESIYLDDQLTELITIKIINIGLILVD